MNTLAPALHRTIIGTDVEGFTDRRRTNPDQLTVRDGLYRALRGAFTRSHVLWQDCYHEDRGDGVLILVSPEVPKELLITGISRELPAALGEYNRVHQPHARIRLRLAVHAGEVYFDEHGVAGKAINDAFRLLEAVPLKRALASSSGSLAVIASQWFFEEVIRHAPASNPKSYRRVHVLVKETDTTGWICLPDDPYPLQEVTPMAAVPQQLPAAIMGFTGRTAELQALTGLVREAARERTVVISVVGGTAGIGKTALVVYWAHQVAGQFGDGQLHVNLRGFDPTRPPMTAAEAVRGFLDALGVPRERIPGDLDAQVAMYRSLLADRQMLVILDNARDAGQVRPLLPCSPGSVVVVTSRNRLDGLVVTEGARPLALDLPNLPDAQALLTRRIGAARVAAEPEAAAQIITSCGRLPLALSIAAARAAAHPRFPLETLADELRDIRRGGLDIFDSGDQATNVRTVFSWSYHQLSDWAQRLFRLLGLHPGPDITPPAAASLAALSDGQARHALAELDRAHLIIEHVPGRFALHDLLRIYAAEQADCYDTQADRQAATHRILDHYLHSAHSAAISLHPRWEPVGLPSPQPGVTPELLAGYPSAWAWLEAERPVLIAIIQQAATEWATHAWQLSWTLMDYFDRRGHWQDLAVIQHTALTAARNQADPQGEAHAHEGLGISLRWLGRYPEAETHLKQALALFAELGNTIGQADTNSGLIWVHQYQGRPEIALRHAQQALTLYQAADHRPGQANAFSDIAWSHTLLGDHDKALAYCQQALTLFRELGERRGQAHTLDTLGYAHDHLGHHQDATDCYQQSLALFRELGDRYSQAAVLDHIGDTHHAVGNPSSARAAWQHALDLLGHIPIPGPCPAYYPDPDQIRAKLHQPGSPAWSSPQRSATATDSLIERRGQQQIANDKLSNS